MPGGVGDFSDLSFKPCEQLQGSPSTLRDFLKAAALYELSPRRLRYLGSLKLNRMLAWGRSSGNGELSRLCFCAHALSLCRDFALVQRKVVEKQK
jgi:hypothetical protein